MTEQATRHGSRIGRRRKRVQPGAAPGLLVRDPAARRATIRAFAYGPAGLVEREVRDPRALAKLLERWPTVWVNVDAVEDVDTIVHLGEEFGLHRLALEDVAHVGQRPKLESYDDHLFVVAHIARLAPAYEIEQLSLFLGERYVLTFQERPGDPFDPVRERLRAGRGRIRAAGADYLAYALLDAVIDLNFPLLDQLGERLEALELETMRRPDDSTLARLHHARRDLLAMRRNLLPHRDMIHALIREDHAQVHPATRVYLRDCHDHAQQLIDSLEAWRDVSSDLMSAYLSSVSNRMNEIMKVLTIIATIFIPLGFVAGVYGMNFDTAVSPFNMPELDWTYGYPFALGLMAAMAGLMLLFFRRLGWLGGARPARRDEHEAASAGERQPDHAGARG